MINDTPLMDDERKTADAFLRLLTQDEFAVLRDCAFPQTTGRSGSRLRAPIQAEDERRQGSRRG
jgi:hypothetical protein